MTTQLTRHMTESDFLQTAEGFLLAHEAAHNLMLSLAAGIARGAMRFDAASYMATVEQGGRVVAAAMRTPPYGLVLSIMPPEAVAPIAADVSAVYPDLPSAHGPSVVSRAFAEEWQRITGRRHQRALAQRIYQLDQVTPVSGVPGELRRATLADRDVALAWSQRFYEETAGTQDPGSDERALGMLGGQADRALYLWHDGRPVSMAGYNGPTPNGMRISYVYTPPELRGRGYASAATAAVSQLLLDAGRRFCFLYTDRSNPTSNRIYQRIGYRPVLDGDEYVFEPRSS
ncbi:MAG TPA: GNAT family N-acetyltransferase [Thermomicrobiales bacterium]|nr:GNAT family N-acetyltransferase [Thermomicrobiales bacterium]